MSVGIDQACYNMQLQWREFLVSFLARSKQWQLWHIYIQCEESGVWGFVVCVKAGSGFTGDTDKCLFAADQSNNTETEDANFNNEDVEEC